tara:strand:+ start:126 stop:431 length:306 start_codon:yes stop_codon:yes gene_type:complete
MSLPTAHNYLLKEWKENLEAIEADFLEPSRLMNHISKTKDALSKDSQTLKGNEFSEDVSGTDREDISEILRKIETLEVKANEKLNWVNQFSQFLESYSLTK